MEIVIGSLFIVFTLYIVWLFVFVFRFDFTEFFKWKGNHIVNIEDTPAVKKEIQIIGKTNMTFIDKMPEFEPVKPFMVIPFSSEKKEPEEMIEDAEPEAEYLSEEEKKEILESEEINASYWDDDFVDNEFEMRNSVDDIYHAAEVIAGKKTSDSDFMAAKETLRVIPEELVELFAQHAINEKRVKALFEDYLNEKTGNKQILPVKLKDFVVKDYID